MRSQELVLNFTLDGVDGGEIAHRVQWCLRAELEELFHTSAVIAGFETDADYATYHLEGYES